jgi:hypothetical protein
VADEAEWIRDRIRRLSELERMVNDDRASAEIERLIAEAEDRLAVLEGRRKGH